MLERISAARRDATAEAVRPVLAWCEDGGDLRDLRKALRRAIDAYAAFLVARPAPAPAGAERSGTLEDLFTRLRGLGKKRGLQAFEVEDAVVLWVSLTSPPAGVRDLADGKVRKRHAKLAADQLMYLLAGRTR